MITIDFADLPSGPWHLLSHPQYVSSYGSANPTPGLNGGYSFISTAFGGSSQSTYEVGMPPENYGPSWGRLREKAVRHLAARGTISCPSSTYIVANTGYGVEQVRRTSTGVLAYASPEQTWSAWRTIERTTTSYQYLYSGSELRNVSSGYGTWYWRSDGDKAIYVGKVINPLVTRASDGLVRVAVTYKSQIVQYRRTVDNKLYRHTTTAYPHHVSTAEEDAVLASIPSSGGTLVSPVEYDRYSFGDLSSLGEFIATSVGTFIRSRNFLEFSPDAYTWSQMALECAEQLDAVDQNVLSLVTDIEDWSRTADSASNLVKGETWQRAVKAFQRGDKSLSRRLLDGSRPIADVNLAYKYGVSPTVTDCKRILDALPNLSKLVNADRRLHSRKVVPIGIPGASYAVQTSVMTVNVRRFPSDLWGGLVEKIAQAKRFGLYPELENLWDILPYSFVLDWFVSVGDFLKDANRYMDMKWYFPVRYVVMSCKYEVGYPITSIVPGLPVTGVVEHFYYHRWISREIPLPTVSLSMESSGRNHTLEAAALVVQKLR